MNRPQAFDKNILDAIKATVSSELDLNDPDVMVAEISFLGIEDSGRIAFELPRWVDTEISTGIATRQKMGVSNMLGRCTWGSLKLNEKFHYPVIVAVFGTSTNSLVFVGVFKALWTNTQIIKWLHSLLDSSANTGRNAVGLPNIFILPSVMLWDANRDILPRMLGYTFTGSVVSNGALSRVYWPLTSFAETDMFAVEERHSQEPAGTLHLTKHLEGFLNPASENGGWLSK